MAKWRPDPDFHKSLRPWKVEGAGRPGWIRITCGWCHKVSYVKRGAWLHDRGNRKYIGRPCTYCFKTGRIPT
jgi:hypothetical protein